VSDTSLVFQFIPKGAAAVQRDIAQTSAAAEAARTLDEKSSKRAAATSRSTSAQITQDDEKVSQSAENKTKKLSTEADKLGKAFKGVTGPFFNQFTLIGTAIAGVIGPVVSFVQAAWQMFGLLAALPAAAFSAGVGLGSLFLIFKGIPAAMQQTAGSAAQMANQLIVAEHGVASAQQSAYMAQKNLNQARIDATRALRDLTLGYAEAGVGQAEAALTVKDAQVQLQQAMATGTLLERQHAELNLQSAQLALQAANNKLADTQYDLNVAQKKGVEGSDQVVAAINQQQEATYQLQQALFTLAQQRAGVGASAAAIAYARLSQAGKDLVNTLRGQVIPAWRGFQQQMQQIGLAGLSTDVVMASAALMTQRGHLYDVAAAWNAVFHSVAGFLESPKTVAGLNVALTNTATASHNLVGAWAPFLDGFLTFTVAGSAFLPRFGTWVTNVATGFDKWATSAAASGKINRWIEEGITAARELGRLIKEISVGIGKIFEAGSGGPDYLGKLADSAERWKNLMATPAMQDQLSKFFASSRDVGSSLLTVISGLSDAITKMPGLLKEAAGALNIVGDALKFAADHAKLMQDIIPPLLVLYVSWKVAVLAKTTADTLEELWEKRKTVAIIAGNVAKFASWVIDKAMLATMWLIRTATLAWVAVQWLLNIAMDANPIGLIVLGIAALIAVIILVIKYHKQLLDAFLKVWDGYIWPFLKAIGAWFAGPFVDFFVNGWHGVVSLFEDGISWITRWVDRFLAPIFAIADKIKQVGIWQALVDGFKAALNSLIYLWNKLDFGIHIKLPDALGGAHFDIDRIFPAIPYLDTGGRITAEGLAYVHRGEEVMSVAQVDRSTQVGGGGTLTLVVQSSGTPFDDFLAQSIRRFVRVQGGGNVQVAFGTTSR
jgi:hypothetical protein